MQCGRACPWLSQGGPGSEVTISISVAMDRTSTPDPPAQVVGCVWGWRRALRPSVARTFPREGGHAQAFCPGLLAMVHDVLPPALSFEGRADAALPLARNPYEIRFDEPAVVVG